jgi:hypothetical protein
VGVRFVGHGHERIRATHAKTLELSLDADITERATCVIAVDARPEPHRPLAGPIRLRIVAGGETFTVHALANPTWDPDGAAVIRRSALRLPGTFATHADAAAADLPPALVTALRSRDAPVEVEIEAEPSARDTVVLFAADPARARDPALAAELDVADVVHAEDAAARTLVGRRTRDGSGAARRMLVVATADLPGRSVLSALAECALETVGLPARLAAAAASPTRGPLVVAPDGADARDLLRTTPASQRLVLTTAAERLPSLLAQAAELRGSADAVLAQDHAPPIRTTAGHVPELPSKDDVHCCFDAAVGTHALDPGVRAALAHLREDGVPTRTIARVLADLTGLPRREAYDLVVRMQPEGGPALP